MKESFTSRGYTYHLVDHITFCDLYYKDSANVTDSYLKECLTAEMAPNKGIFKQVDEEFYFYISPQATEDDIFFLVMEHYETAFPDDSYMSAFHNGS